MTTFNKGEKASEAKYRRDQELLFKVTARRNKLLGLWAAEKMGLADSAAYAKEVVVAHFAGHGDDDVLQKVLGDLQAKGVETSEHVVRKHMNELMDEAASQVEAEKAAPEE
jgi:hypothetical protein